MYSSHRSQTNIPPTNLEVKDEKVKLMKELEILGAHREELEKIVSQKGDAKKQFIKEDQKLKDILNDIKIAQEELDKKIQLNETKNKELADKQQEHQKFVGALSDAQESQRFLKVEVAETEADKKKLQVDIKNLTLEYENEKSKQEEKKSNFTKELASLQSEIEDSKDELNKTKTGISIGKKQLSDVNDKIKVAKSLLKDFDDLIVSGKDKILDATNVREAFEKDIQGLQEKRLAFIAEHEKPMKDRESAMDKREGEANLTDKLLEDKRLEILEIKSSLEKFYNRKLPNFHV